MNRVKKNKKKGFTLVELMIVIVIMVILAAAAAPVFTGYVKKAAAAKHLADCHSIYTAATAVISEKAAKKIGKNEEVTEVEVANILDDVKTLSAIEAIEADEPTEKDTYSFELSELKDGLQTVSTVTYYDGDKLWVFTPADGEYSMKTAGA